MNRLYAISDIHGCFDTFYELIVNRIRPDKSDKLILLGDYIDRGPKSKEVIDFIIDLKDSGLNIVTLAGNHEVMLMDSIRDSTLLPLWLLNNGDTTLDSFQIEDVTQIENQYIEFLHSLSYFHIAGKICFVHAGFNDNSHDPFSDVHGMIWECHPYYNNPLLNGFTIIHGHRPKTIEHVLTKISSGEKVIPIDTGCVYGQDMGYGYLSALEVNSMQLTWVEKI